MLADRSSTTTAGRVALAALAYVFVLLSYSPWAFSLPDVGSEPSWSSAITYAAEAGWTWGRDLVYSYGPLGFVLPHLYSESLLGWGAALMALLAIALTTGMLEVSDARPLHATVLLFLLLLVPTVLVGRWVVFTTLPLFAALGHLAHPGRPLRVQTAFLAVAAGIFALVYVASGVLSLALFALIDASRIQDRRFPVVVLIFAGSALAAFLLAGQEISALGVFLQGSYELISGYASAVAIEGNPVELVAFVVLSATGFVLLVRAEWRQGDRSRDAVNAALVVVALSIFGFVQFKRGFVRHDAHSIGAWFSLAILTASYVAMRWPQSGNRQGERALIAISLAASVIGVFVQDSAMRAAGAPNELRRVFVTRPWASLKQATAAATDPAGWRLSWRERLSGARAAVLEKAPVPHVAGTVDVIPFMQSSLLAAGLNYRPRPVFQSYAAYTPWLMERNRSYFRSESAARYVLFRPETIDGRYPMLDQGPAAIELLSRYDPLRIEHDLLVLERRVTPLEAVETDRRDITAALGEWIELMPRDAPIFLRAEIAYNFWGRLAGAALRPPFVTLSVRLASGAVRTFRLVPGMAQAGFLLSPLVLAPIDLAAVAMEAHAAVATRRVAAFKIDTGSEFGRALAAEPVRIAISSLQVTGGARAPAPDIVFDR